MESSSPPSYLFDSKSHGEALLVKPMTSTRRMPGERLGGVSILPSPREGEAVNTWGKPESLTGRGKPKRRNAEFGGGGKRARLAVDQLAAATGSSVHSASDFCVVEMSSCFTKLAPAMVAEGISALVFEEFTSPRDPKVPAIRVDLSAPAAWCTLDDLRVDGKLLFVHLDLPRATCRPAKFAWATKAALRSRRFPLGKRGLDEEASAKLERANAAFELASGFLGRCAESATPFALLHPASSLLWRVAAVRKLAAFLDVSAVDFSVYKGPKHTKYRVMTNEHSLAAALSNLMQSDLSTSKADGGYPKAVKDIMVKVAAKRLKECGVPLVSPSPDFDRRPARAKARAAAGVQARGAKYPQLISEYAEVRTVEIPAEMHEELGLKPRETISELAAKAFEISKTSRVVEKKCGEGGVWSVQLGIPHSVREFNALACSLQHPFDSSGAVSDGNKVAMFGILTKGPSRVKELAECNLQRWMKRAAALAGEERALHRSLSAAKCKLLEGKRLLLFRGMCEESHLDDPALFDLLSKGVPLVGDCPDAPEFEPQVKPAPLTVAQLRLAAKHVVAASKSKRAVRGNRDLEQAVWLKTKEELSQGWLTGPYTHEELELKFGGVYLVNRRFGVPQGEDVRVVDDFSESLANLAYSSPFAVRLEGVDEIVIAIRTMLEAVGEDRSVQVTLSTGRRLRGVLHDSLTLHQARDVAIRLLDLKTAYKQMVVCDSTSWASPIGVMNPDSGREELFVPEVMPFGTTAAVFAFSRAAHSIKRIGSEIFGLVWISFFDDFCQLDLVVSGQSSKTMAEKFLALIGWAFSAKGSKRKPFAKSAEVLGAVIDLSESCKGIITVSNKPSRIAELDKVCLALEKSGKMTQQEAASIKGKISFAEGQVFSKTAALMLPELRRRSLAGSRSGNVRGILEELRWFAAFLKQAVPRRIMAKDTRPPLVILTDASLLVEEGHSGIGAVVLNPDSTPAWYLEDVVPPMVMQWLQADTPFVINALEVLPVWIARVLWGDLMRHRRVFVFVDNDGARHALLKMSSNSKSVAKILHKMAEAQAYCPAFVWFCRVPTASNIADAPSRGESRDLVAAGAIRSLVPAGVWDDILSASRMLGEGHKPAA